MHCRSFEKSQQPCVQADLDGVMEEEAKASEPSPKRLRPNPKFLHGYLNGLEKANKRILAETASNAACKVTHQIESIFTIRPNGSLLM